MCRSSRLPPPAPPPWWGIYRLFVYPFSAIGSLHAAVGAGLVTLFFHSVLLSMPNYTKEGSEFIAVQQYMWSPLFFSCVFVFFFFLLFFRGVSVCRPASFLLFFSWCHYVCRPLFLCVFLFVFPHLPPFRSRGECAVSSSLLLPRELPQTADTTKVAGDRLADDVMRLDGVMPHATA